MDVGHIVFSTVVLSLAILIPGIAISFAVFPKKEDLNTVERAGLSMIFGFIPSLISYFNAKNLHVPIDVMTSSATIAFTTFLAFVIWLFRRK
jgi:uncharacterized membrane protein